MNQRYRDLEDETVAKDSLTLHAFGTRGWPVIHISVSTVNCLVIA